MVVYIMETLCGTQVCSTDVSRTVALLDDELEKWRNRPLGQKPYLVLDARYEKAHPEPERPAEICIVMKRLAIGLKQVHKPRRVILNRQCFIQSLRFRDSVPEVESQSND